MKYLCKVALAAFIVAAPAQAQASEWWLVTGEPGDDVAQFADSASIVDKGPVRTIHIVDHWRDGRAVSRTISIHCDRTSNVALNLFACGDDAYRMRTAMLLGEMHREDFARVLFSVAPSSAATATAIAN